MEIDRGLLDASPQIQDAARVYLIDNIGDLTFPGVPRYDARQSRWKVTILCRTDRGIFPAGEIEMTTDCQIVSAPSREDVVRSVSRMKERTPLLVYGSKSKLTAAGFEVVEA